MSHPQDKLYKITTLVDKYSSRFPETPFLAHLDYFANNDNITTDSIATKMSKLTGDYYIVSRLKAGVVIKAANQNLQKGECPYYKDSFKSEELMPRLKHFSDTGNVNKDGSINKENLIKMLLQVSEYNHDKDLVVKKSNIVNYLQECAERDKLMPQYGPYYVKWKTVAAAEWTDFYNIFKDYELDGDPVVYLDTMLLFYFDGKSLYTINTTN